MAFFVSHNRFIYNTSLKYPELFLFLFCTQSVRYKINHTTCTTTCTKKIWVDSNFAMSESRRKRVAFG